MSVESPWKEQRPCSVSETDGFSINTNPSRDLSDQKRVDGAFSITAEKMLCSSEMFFFFFIVMLFFSLKRIFCKSTDHLFFTIFLHFYLAFI